MCIRDSYVLGLNLLENLQYFEHTNVGYERLRVGDPPTNAVDLLKYDPLAWEVEREGLRAVSRHEIDLPMQLGAFKVVPYVAGEVGHWQEALDQQERTRLLGQTGIRASLPFWRVDPTLRNELLNLTGLAHKAVFETEFFAADASETTPTCRSTIRSTMTRLNSRDAAICSIRMA